MQKYWSRFHFLCKGAAVVLFVIYIIWRRMHPPETLADVVLGATILFWLIRSA